MTGRRAHAGRVDVLREHLAAQRAEGERLRQAIRAAKLGRDLALELLHADGRAPPLSALPWLAAVIAALSSLLALFCAYVTALGAPPAWTTLGLVAVVGASLAGLVARRPGAGGRARRALRDIASGASVLAAVVLLLAAHR